MLNFEGADLREVVKAVVVDFLRETYIMDSRVQGVVNLHTTSPIPRTALLPTLETILRMNGAAIVKEEGVFKIVPAATAGRGSITPQLGGAKAPMPGGYSVQIVPLKFLAAREMNKILEPYVTDATAIRIDETRNLVILSGTERELRHLMETIDMFDIDWLAGMSVGLFTLQNVDVKTATADLDKVFGAAAQSPLSGIVKLVPIERLNAILVVTPQPKYLEQAKIWIERMDRAGGSGGGTRLFVYSVKNSQAEKLATLINDVFGKSKTTKVTPAPTLAPGLTPSVVNSTIAQAQNPPGTPPATATQAGSGDIAVSGDVRVIADKDNNALLVLASPSDYEKIESAIRRLDIVPRQVLVDVTVAEVTLEGNLQFGLNWYFANAKNQANAPAFAGGNSGTLSGGIKDQLAAGAQYIWSNARVGALATLLQTDSRSKIISSPHIMVTDNQIAKINVGSSISVTTQQQTVPGAATGILTGTTYVATGVILSVTPHIRASGMITMEIDQQVTAPGIAEPVGSNPPINTKSIQSTVTVRSGETMVLGGLISDSSTFGTSGLPGLSVIPVIGGLFGSQGYKTGRTELVMLITPRVVENSTQAQEVTDEFRRKLTGLESYFEKSGKFIEKPKAGQNEK
ncbi:type II secretion system secretin GspD [soil metagenome]